MNAEELMTKPALTIRAEEPLNVAAQKMCGEGGSRIGLAELLMAEHEIRRLAVVDANDKPIGIVSMNDFAREATRPGSRIKDGVARALNTLAAICQPRSARKRHDRADCECLARPNRCGRRSRALPVLSLAIRGARQLLVVGPSAVRMSRSDREPRWTNPPAGQEARTGRIAQQSMKSRHRSIR